MVVITGHFANATSQFMICLRPVEGGRTECQVIPFARKARNPLATWLLQPLTLWVRRLFTGGYLIAETEALGSPRYNPRSLIEADREFFEATSARGLDGWVSWYAEDAARIDLFGKIARGPAEIREMDAPMFEDETVRLEWSPTDAGLFGDGTHGFTRGRYEVIRREPGKDPVVRGTGSYLTLWRREADGWKVILDTGARDSQKKAEENE